ncbi:MAG TPA: phosphate signaling complex protein PhoU [Caldilineaceae bacterium]|nr:phosphate signaling complex protein PhoU [Caldilineaceae bacterium]
MPRQYFDQALRELRDQILTMGSYVAEELRLAMAALEALDEEAARQVYEMDRSVNDIRFAIEEECFTLIVTQQPAARDLRLVFAAANMIVDLERMGDQAKGIAKLIPHLKRHPNINRPPELRQLGALVHSLLNDALRAYAEGDTELSASIAQRDDEVDALYANIFTNIMFQLAQANDPEQVKAIYELLRAARELERFGDLVANVAERSIYMVTGKIPELRATSPISGRGR